MACQFDHWGYYAAQLPCRNVYAARGGRQTGERVWLLTDIGQNEPLHRAYRVLSPPRTFWSCRLLEAPGFVWLLQRTGVKCWICAGAIPLLLPARPKAARASNLFQPVVDFLVTTSI